MTNLKSPLSTRRESEANERTDAPQIIGASPSVTSSGAPEPVGVPPDLGRGRIFE